jgi:hypothetical protein
VSERQRLAHACKILVAGIGARALWTDDGPTDAARELRDGDRAGLTAEQSQLLDTAWAIWADAPPPDPVVRPRSGSFAVQLDLDEAARAITALHGVDGLRVAGAGTRLTARRDADDGDGAIVSIVLRTDGSGTRIELAHEPVKRDPGLAALAFVGSFALLCVPQLTLVAIPALIGSTIMLQQKLQPVATPSGRAFDLVAAALARLPPRVPDEGPFRDGA